MHRLKFYIITAFAIALLWVPVVHAQDNTLTGDEAFGGDTGLTAEDLAGTAGLGVLDPRLIIARIINVALGFLGIIAVGFIIYAGFLWMISQGNPQQIEKAKKILTGAVIGLAIVLASFAIAAFVMRALTSATTGGGGSGSEGGGGGINPGGAGSSFVVNATYPTSGATNVPRNAVITYQFNQSVADASVIVGDTLEIGYLSGPGGNMLNPWGASDIQKDVSGSIIELTPTATCADLGPGFASINCLPANTDIVVTAKSGILSVGGQSLACSFGGCSITFTTGMGVDQEAPVITQFNVGSGTACIASPNAIAMAATDDYGVRRVRLFIDGVLEYDELIAAAPTSWSDAIEWSGAGYSEGQEVVLQMEVDDVDAHQASATQTVTMSADPNCNNASFVGPIIDYVSPVDDAGVPNGAPGNLVTIGGRYFETYDPATSKVYFGDGEGDWNPAQLASAINASCGTSWTNNEIIAVVPGAPGVGANIPIKVERAGDDGPLDDVTNGGLGADIPDFAVNNVVRPGLCKINTMAGGATVGGAINLQGINFAPAPAPTDRPQHVRFGVVGSSLAAAQSAIASWADTSISAPRIPVMQPGNVSVFVTSIENVASNYITLDVGANEDAPIIYNVTPPAGHPGDYITITGANFGNQMGTVTFGAEEADINFPNTCGVVQDLWSDGQILVKVPATVTDGTYDITVELADGATQVAWPDFLVGNYCSPGSVNEYESCEDSGCTSAAGVEGSGVCITEAKPGLCLLSPDNGPVGTEVTMAGERFGPSEGSEDAVTFYDGVIAGIDAWGNAEIMTSVPAGAQTGAVTVTNEGVASNPLNFSVGSCLDSGSAGEGNATCDALGATICCAANTQLPGACVEDVADCGIVEGSTYSQYYVEFSTAIDGGSTDYSATAPQVIEECDRSLDSCSERDLPSPSPSTPRPIDAATWTDDPSTLACVNSIVTARFNQPIDYDTLRATGDDRTVSVYSCGQNSDGSLPSVCAPTALAPSATSSLDVFSTNEGSGFIWTPAEDFLQNNWYRVVLRGGADGIAHATTSEPMAADYVWHFKTRGEGRCGLSCLAVTPSRYTATERNETIDYLALPQASDSACIMLNGQQYSYEWQSNDPTRATVGGSTTQTNVATALAETLAGDPVDISATTRIDDNYYSGKGELTIDFPDFYFTKVFPSNDCTTTCTNAAVGGYLNRETGSGTSVRVQLHRCDDDKCEDGLVDATTEGVTLSPSIEGTKLTFGLSGAMLRPNTRYLAAVETSLTDSNGTRLGASTISGTKIHDYVVPDAVAWQFQTGPRACQADSLTVTPNPAIATYVGQAITHHSTPYTNDASCSVETQEPQELRGYQYNWIWNSVNPAVASLQSPLLKYDSDGDGEYTSADKNAPRQPVTAEGLGDIITNLDAQCTELAEQGYDTDSSGRYVGQHTNINATITAGDPDAVTQPDGVSNSNNFCLLCGNDRDDECRDASGNVASGWLGVGNNSCCFERPFVEKTTPNNNATNICRNAYIEVEFSQLMDTGTFANNVTVAAQYEGSCPDGTQYLELALNEPQEMNWWQHILQPIKRMALAVNQWRPVYWLHTTIAQVPVVRNFFSLPTGLAQTNSNWCAVAGTVSSYTNNDNRSVLTFAPQALLPAGRNHVILVAGDSNINDGEKEGVRSIAGVTMKGAAVSSGSAFCGIGNDCVFNGKAFYGYRSDFVTLSADAQNEGVCVADRVVIDPSRWLFRSNQNDARDDDPANAASFDSIDTDNDKVFYSKVLAANGQPIGSVPGVYDWSWTWSTDNTAIASIQSMDANEAVVATDATDGGMTYVKAHAKITSAIRGIPSSIKTGSAPLNVFLCQNPWPLFTTAAGEEWPFVDEKYNFSLMYCRDRGTAALNDDLPSLEGIILEGATAVDESILREHLFTYGAELSAPTGVQVIAGLVDGRGDLYPEGSPDGILNEDDVSVLIDLIFMYDYTVEGGGIDPDVFVRADINGDSILDAEDINALTELRATNGLLQWDRVPGATHYRLYQQSGSDNVPAVRSVAASSVCQGDTCITSLSDMQPGVQYSVAVTAVYELPVVEGGSYGDATIESDFSETVTVFPEITNVIAPDRLYANVTGSTVQLQWRNRTNGEPRYSVYFGPDSSNAVEQNVRDAGQRTVYDITGLERGRTYYFKVRAHAEVGGSFADSEVIQVRVDEPMAYWRINEGASAAIANYSGTSIGPAIHQGTQEIWDDTFLQFSESTVNFLRIDSFPATQVASVATGGFTQQAWVQVRDIPNAGEYYGIVGYGAPNARVPSLLFSRENINGTGSQLRIHGGATSENSGEYCRFFTEGLDSVLQKGEWYHIAATYDKATYAVYINGGELGRYVLDNDNNPQTSTVGVCDYQKLLYNTNTLSIGRVGSEYFNGGIADVMLYNYVRTSAQIQSDYNAQGSRYTQ